MSSPTGYRFLDPLLRARVLVIWVIVVALARFINLGFVDLQGWDEGLYALRSASIVHFGDWIDQTPHVPGGLATSCYPPLTFWTTAVFYKAFGASEWTTRLTSALFGAGSVLLLVLLVRRIASVTASFFSGILLGTNLFCTFLSRQGQLDIAYIFFILLSIHGWVRWSDDRTQLRGLILIAIGTCGAFMSKILVGLYVPLILLLLDAVDMRKEWRWSRLVKICLAVAAGMVIALPWHVLMFLRYGQGFLDTFLGLHLVQRLASPIEGHNPALGPFFYINQVIVRYPESSLAIGFIVLLFFKEITNGLMHKVLAIALVPGAVVFAIITVMATKIPQYSLPLVIPIALLGGCMLDLLLSGSLTRRASIILSAIVSLAATWSALWPLRVYIKTGVLGIQEPGSYAAFPWIMLLIAAVSCCFTIVMVVRRTQRESKHTERLFVIALMMLFTLRLLIEVTVTDQTQYDIGTKRIAALLRKGHAQRVIYIGKDLNPALEVYLKGWDEWRTDVALDSYLSESTALASKSTSIGVPRFGEVTLLVEEKRITDDEHFTNVSAARGNRLPLFTNPWYRVYDVTASQ